MQFTKFGRTGLTVSRMILGTGTFGKQTDEKEAHRMLDRAAEGSGQVTELAGCFETQMIMHDFPGDGVFGIASFELKQQAFAHVLSADTGRLKRLDSFETGLHFG